MNALQTKVIEWNQGYYERQATKEGKGKKWVSNRVNKVIEQMKAIESAEAVESVKISVEWKRNATWGNNPRATIEVFTTNRRYEFIGTASGCGYDKESASVASAFNDSPQLLKLLYDALETDKKKPYGVRDSETGAYYEGGVGMSCYRNIAEYLGFNLTEAHGKTFDFYQWSK